MDWDRLRVFQKVVEAKSLTAAGTLLNLTQSAVSRQISQLEKDLGTKLFTRHARGLLLTEDGETLHQTVRHITALLNKTQNTMHEMQNEVRGTLKIATTTGMGTLWLPMHLKKFSDAYPEIHFQFILTDGEIDFNMREADIFIRFANTDTIPDNIIQKKLFDVSLSIYGTEAYFAKHGKPTSYETLSNHKLIVFGEQSIAPARFVNLLLTLGTDPTEVRYPIIQVPNAFAIMEYIRNGFGIGLIADYLAKDNPELIPIFKDVVTPKNEIVILYPKELEKAKKIQEFVRFIQEETHRINL